MLHLRFSSSPPDTNSWLQDDNLAFAKVLVDQWYTNASHFEFHSSGSTGVPKTILLSKTFLEESAIRTIRLFNINTEDSLLLALNTSFMGGAMMVIRAIMAQTELYSLPAQKIDTATLKQLPLIKLASFVPAQISKLLEYHSDDPFKNITNILIGGGPISQTLENNLIKLESACRFYHTYGMTETASHVALRTINGSNNFYHALEGYTFSSDEQNRLQIHYHGKSSFDLTTNDVVKLQNDKSFEWIGRYDWVVNSGGIKYSLEQAETIVHDFFIAHNIPHAFTSYKVPDEKWGERWVLIVEGKLSQEVSREIVLYCKNRLGKYIYPKEIIFTSKLTYLPSGKIDRKNCYAKTNLYL